jgi:hypothetical protein
VLRHPQARTWIGEMLSSQGVNRFRKSMLYRRSRIRELQGALRKKPNAGHNVNMDLLKGVTGKWAPGQCAEGEFWGALMRVVDSGGTTTRGRRVICPSALMDGDVWRVKR